MYENNLRVHLRRRNVEGSTTPLALKESDQTNTPDIELWLIGCRFKSNCPLVRPGTTGGMPSWWSFEWILTRIYTSIRENHGKLRTTRSTSVTGNKTRHLPSISFEQRNALPLLGLGYRRNRLFWIHYSLSWWRCYSMSCPREIPTKSNPTKPNPQPIKSLSW